MRTDGLCKNFLRTGTIPARSIVSFAADGSVELATDSSAPMPGVSSEVDAASEATSGCDVFLVSSIPEARAAAAIDAGDFITAAAGGAGEPLDLAAGGFYVGIAATGAATGDFFPLIVGPGYVTPA